MSQIQFKELDHFLQNKNYIIGCDEVGTGAICGSLIVCGVRANKDWSLEGLNDSKKLSRKKRELMRQKLLENNQFQFHITGRSNQEIDELGLSHCLKDAYLECFHQLYTNDSLIVCDGTLKFNDLDMDQVSLIKADTMVPSVMAASILGKTNRDAIMRRYHKNYPQYGWDKNVGYGTAKHLSAIKKYGFSPLHRLSYKINL